MTDDTPSRRSASSRSASGRSASGRSVGSRSAGSRSTSGKGLLAAGAERASGERARRRSTPLIGDGAGTAVPGPVTDSAPGSAAPTPREVPDVVRSGVHRPVPKTAAVPSPKAVTRSGARATSSRPSRRRGATTPGAGDGRAAGQPGPDAPLTDVLSTNASLTDSQGTDSQGTGAQGTGAQGTDPQGPGSPDVLAPGSKPRPVRRGRSERQLRAVPDIPAADPAAARAASDTRVTPGAEELVKAAVDAMRVTAEASGLSAEEIEQVVARALAFVRRRVTGDYAVDDFGFDPDFTENVYLPLLRPLYRTWFRVEVRGIEHLPSEGGGLVVANHSGTVAMDSLMTQVAVHDEHPAHRHLRMLGADLVFSTPVVNDLARKSGSTLAANTDAERLLDAGELVGVWPEGFKGVGKPFSERYKLQRFGRGGFVSAALRTGVPIIPCSIVGAEEIYPILGNMNLVARLLGLPYAPITPTWPLLGPLGLIPLPSKWIIEFGAPVDTSSLGASAADDPMLVFDLTDQVRETIQQTLYSLLMQRRSVFS